MSDYGQQQYQNYLGTQRASENQTYPDAPKPQRLVAVSDHFVIMLKGMTEASERLSRLADRLGGTVPEAVEKAPNGLQGARSDIAGRLEQTAESYSAALRRVFSAIERLETL